jgi:hypothetical protein
LPHRGHGGGVAMGNKAGEAARLWLSQGERQLR